jgi:hypothetical protein
VLLLPLRKRRPAVRMPQQRHRRRRSRLLRIAARRERHGRLLWQHCRRTLARQRSRTRSMLCLFAAARRELHGRRPRPHLQSWRRAASCVAG